MKKLEDMNQEELTAVREKALKEHKHLSDQLDAINKEIKERKNYISPEQAEKYRDEIIWMVNRLEEGSFLRTIYTILLRHFERGLN